VLKGFAEVVSTVAKLVELWIEVVGIVATLLRLWLDVEVCAGVSVFVNIPEDEAATVVESVDTDVVKLPIAV